MRQFFSKLFGQTGRKASAARTSARRHGARLGLEGLEERSLLSGTRVLPPEPPTLTVLPAYEKGIHFDAGTGMLALVGDSGENTASVSIVNGKLAARLTVYHEAEVLIGKSYEILPLKAEYVAEYSLLEVSKVLFQGHGSNDSFANNTSITSYAYGGSGGDDLRGGSGTDYLYGDEGMDTLTGGAGNDYLNGGSGSDVYVFAGASQGATASPKRPTPTPTRWTSARSSPRLSAGASWSISPRPPPRPTTAPRTR